MSNQEIESLKQQINATANLYDFEMDGTNPFYITWPQLGLKAKLEKFIYKNFELTAQCTMDAIEKDVRDQGGDAQSRRYIRARINLTNLGSKTQWLNSLKRKDPDINWSGMLEQTAESVEEMYLAGTPEVQLNGAPPETSEEKFIAKPILEKESITVLYADGSSAKSYFGQYLSVLLSEGITHNGLNTEGLQVPVMYLDWETNKDELDQRIGKIRRGLGVAAESNGNFWYKRMFLPISEDIEVLRDVFSKRQIQVCIIDSLSAAADGQLEAAETITKTFNSLRSLKGVSFLIISHVNRADEMFGSRYTWNNARNVIRVKKTQDEGSSELSMGLWSEKSNNDIKFKPMTFVFDFGSPNNVLVQRVAIEDSALSDEMSVGEKIRKKLIEEGPMTKQKLAEDLDKSENHIQNELKKYRYDPETNPIGWFHRLGEPRDKDLQWGARTVER